MTDKTKQTNPPKKAGYVKSLFWLVEATFRGYAGYMLLVHFRSNYIAVAAGVYALATGLGIVCTHFVNAHN